MTKLRWIVEARNGDIESIFKFLQQIVQIQHLPYLGDFYRIAGAIINRQHHVILMEGADVELAQEMINRVREANAVQARVKAKQLYTRNAQRWVPGERKPTAQRNVHYRNLFVQLIFDNELKNPNITYVSTILSFYCIYYIILEYIHT